MASQPVSAQSRCAAALPAVAAGRAGASRWPVLFTGKGRTARPDRPQRQRQDHPPARAGPAGAGRGRHDPLAGADVARRPRGLARHARLARPSGRASRATSRCARIFWSPSACAASAGGRRAHRRCPGCLRSHAAGPRAPCAPCRPASAGAWRWRGSWRANAPLWLLDEPLNALDADAQAALRVILESHLDDGGLAIAATHAPIKISGARTLELRP